MNIFVSIIVAILLFFAAASTANANEKIAGHSGQLIVENTSVLPDSRVEKLKFYLEKHNSPLAKHAEYFVATADKYELGENWCLVPAIAGVESTFGKRIPKNSYNAWGWGIPTGARSGIGFNDWEDGIETVTAGLKTRYIDRGADTLPEMGRIYAPPSKTWARNVQFFMDKIESTEVPVELTLAI